MWWSEASPPAVASRARGLIGASLQRHLSWRPAGQPFQPGLPPGCSRETVDQACKKIVGEPASTTRYRHLSSWKPHGAFLVEATTDDSETATLIFKRTVATAEFNPVVEHLPFMPGPPEYAILRSPPEQLQQFLPRVFAITEPDPGVEHAVLMEDLGHRYRGPGRSDVPALIRHLPHLHTALAGVVPATDDGRLIDYLAVREEIPEFFRDRLVRHHDERGDRLVGRLLTQFDSVADAYRSAVVTPPEALGIVHGDPNLSNIRLPRDGYGPPRFIDWEWAGVHLLHIDLAAILKFSDPLLERDSVRLYARLNPQLSGATHRRLYYWCKLDRSLLDICLMATLTELPTPAQIDVDKFLRRSTRAALHAYTQLDR